MTELQKVRKLSRLGWMYGLVAVVICLGMVGYFYWQVRFTASLAMNTGAITVQMIPRGAETAEVVPGLDEEIAVNASTPQIAYVYDEQYAGTYLAVYLPRQEMRKQYLDAAIFQDGSTYSGGKNLRLADGRCLHLDFEKALALEAELWVDRQTEPEQGILILTNYSDVHLTEDQQRCCTAVYAASRDERVQGFLYLWAALLMAGPLVAVFWLATSILFALYGLWHSRTLDKQAAEESEELNTDKQVDEVDYNFEDAFIRDE